MRAFDVRLRLGKPRLRLCDGRIALERLRDELRQLRVAELACPLERRPLSALGLQALRRIEVRDALGRLVALDSGVVCTTGEHERGDCHGGGAFRPERAAWR